VFATTQIAFSFVLLAGAAMLVATLIALQAANTGFLMQQVLAFDVIGPAPPSDPRKGVPEPDVYGEVSRQILELPGVEAVVGGAFVPFRDAGKWKPIQFTVEGYTPANGEDDPFARHRWVGPGYFAALGIPVVAGREFTDHDRNGDNVALVSQSLAQRLFPDGAALNRFIMQTGGLSTAGNSKPKFRIAGVVADIEDEKAEHAPAMAIYLPYLSKSLPDRIFVRIASGDPYALVPAVTRIIRDRSANQGVNRPATLADVRADVLTPQRLNAFVVSGFAGIALLIAVVGVAGVLAFGVSARTREFGVRLAIGSTPSHLLRGVLSEGAAIVAIGIVAGVACGYALSVVAAGYFAGVTVPGAMPVVAAAVVLAAAAILASLMPAARASRVDVLQALRSE
jgi:ABC-type antimicrobial peptide transport system permease subunit